MWRLVREGLRIYRPVLLYSWLIATFAGAVVPAGLALFDVISPRGAVAWRQLAWPAYIVLASAVAGWIVLGNEMTEHRLRLHLLLPLPLRNVGLAQLLLPTFLLAFGWAAAHAVSVTSAVVGGSPFRWQGPAWIDLIAAHLLLLLQLSFAVKEIVSASGDGWRRGVAASLFPLLVLLAQGGMTVRFESAGVEAVSALALAGLVMAHNLALFGRRSQFAR